MHRLLKRQLQRHLGSTWESDERLLPFVEAINAYYQELDQERSLLENALQVNTAELVAVNEKLQAQNAEQTRTMLNTLSDGVYATDLNGNITFINAATEQILGYREAALLGQPVHATLHHTRPDGTPFPREECALLQVYQQGLAASGEDYFIHRDGRFIPVAYRANPLLLDGKLAGSLVSFQDITLRQQAERAMREAHDQALEASRMKSEFLSTMSHEIRTPMNGIIGMTDLLLDTPLDSEQTEFAETVRDSAQALLGIINDILDFSKVEAGKMEVEQVDCSLVRIIESVAELLAVKAQEKQVSLMAFIDPALPPVIRTDPTRLRQVLLNLLGNAVKFTEQGEILVRALPDESGQHICIEVHDSGIGMSEQAVRNLFQAFMQADSSTTRKYGGTGLGLAICKRLIELMGGDISVSSQLGQGSVFRIRLPLIVGTASPEATPRRNLANLRVLVVDDLATDREIVQRYVQSWGMRCDCAAGAVEALQLIRRAVLDSDPYDMAVVDFSMPGMDGVTLGKNLRADHTFDHTRLLLLTAFDQRNLLQQARDAGFSVCMTKPLRQSDLYDALATGSDSPDGQAEATIATPAPAVTAPAAGADTTPASLDDEKPLILLVEDNAVNQRLAVYLLEKLGYRVRIANNGEEAVRLAQTLPYAVILMDCQMPVMDGFEATRQIRQREQQRRPIIAMTANAMQGDRERCLAVGMDDYVSKPINATQLREVLTHWMAEAPSPATAAVKPPERPNFEQLLELFGDRAALTPLFEIFTATLSEALHRLQAEAAHQQTTAVFASAHEIKGSCSNLGLLGMTASAAAIETACQQNDWHTVYHHVGLLAELFRQAEQEIALFQGVAP